MRTSFIILISLCLIGCVTSTERAAYNTVVSAKAFLDSEKNAHLECMFPTDTQGHLSGLSANTSLVWCVNINKGVASKDLLIDAITTYCAGPVFNAAGGLGACNPPAKGTPASVQAQAKLQSAIDNYKQVQADLKGLK